MGIAHKINHKGYNMFDNVEIKIKGDTLVVKTTGVMGSEPILKMPISATDTVDWGKEVKEAIVATLIKKGFGEQAVKLASKKAS